MTTYEENILPSAPRKPVVSKDLAHYAKDGESIHVKNTLKTITVFQKRVDGAEEISEFQASGSPTGEDVMELPSSYLKDAKFREALRKGIFKIVGADSQEVLDAYEAQTNSYEAARQGESESDKLMNAQPIRAFSGTQCLAPDGRSQCAEFAVYATNTRERPPLCQKHAHLSSQYISQETGKFTDGKADVQWTRVGMSN
jgi:hypothetical protein